MLSALGHKGSTSLPNFSLLDGKLAKQISSHRPLSRTYLTKTQHQQANATTTLRSTSVTAQSRAQSTAPASKDASPPYWQHIKGWEDVTEDAFLSYRWQVSDLYSCFFDHS